MTVNVVVATYGQEVNWHIDDGEVYGPYPDYAQDTQVIFLEPGSHTLNTIDTYGDGWHGGTIEVVDYIAPIHVHGTGGLNHFHI